MSAQERQNTHGHRFIPDETRNKESDSRANGSQRTSQETIQIGRNTAKTEKKSQVLYFDDIKRNSVGKSAIFPKRKKEVIEIIDVDSLPDEPTSGQLYSSSGSNPISVPFKRIYTMINWQCKMCSKRFSDEWEAIKHSSDAHKRVFTESHFIKEFRYSKSEPVKKNISHLEPRWGKKIHKWKEKGSQKSSSERHQYFSKEFKCGSSLGLPFWRAVNSTEKLFLWHFEVNRITVFIT